MLVSDWLTHSLTNSLLFSKLDRCDPGMWRWQLKTCWSCYCCWRWWWETCRQQFGAVGRWTLVIKLSFCSDFEDKVSRFVQDFEVNVQARFWSWSLVIMFLLLMLGCGYEVHSWSRSWFGLVKIFKLMFRQDFEAEVCSLFCYWCLVVVMKFNLGRDSEARFGQDFEF